MNLKSVKRYFKIILVTGLILAMTLCVFGCKKDDSGTYAEEVTEFYQKLSTYDAKINTIDSKASDADVKLLEILDQMDNEFKEFAALDPPASVPEAKEHANNASKCMSNAVSYYHEAFKGEKPDETALQNAKLQYENAFIEIKNVGVALQNAN